MPTSVVLQDEFTVDMSAGGLSRSGVLARYRRLRAISVQHHSKVMDFLSADAMLQPARRLGLAAGRMFILDSMDEMTFVNDLAIHTAPAGRSRAIDRYAKSGRVTPGTDEMLVLDAMRTARFSILRIERRHPIAGLIVTDLFREINLWLVDEGLELSAPDRSLMATRLFTPEGFSMTCGVLVPLDGELMFRLLEETPQLAGMPVTKVIDDRRFAETLYRIAIADGVADRIAFVDPLPETG